MLYLRSASFFPFKRVSFYVLDKILIKESNNYKNPTYDGLAGYILDLKHAIAHKYFNYNIYNNNYIHSLTYIEKILNSSNSKDYTIIDFGCGAGVFARIVKEKFKEASVIGLDIRKETMDYNSIIHTEITWGLTSDLGLYIKDLDTSKIILVNDGVLNFMEENDINAMLSEKIKYLVWFYYFSFKDPKKEYASTKKTLFRNKDKVTDFNLPLFLTKHSYSFDYKLVTMGDINFIIGVSTFKNNLVI